MWLEERILERHVLKRHWIVCLKYDNYSILGLIRNIVGGVDLYDTLMCTRIFTLITNKICM